VRLLHVLLYAIAGRRDPDLLGAVLRFTPGAWVEVTDDFWRNNLGKPVDQSLLTPERPDAAPPK